MAVTEVQTGLDDLTMRVKAEFDAGVDRVWQLYADPRKLEQWWGPPTYPATMTEHDLRPSGMVRYYMTGPDGERFYGLWEITEVSAPHLLAFVDRFANEDGSANTDLPASTMRLELVEKDGRTTLTAVTTFASREAMQTVLDMGMEEGMREAMGQMDAVLAA